MKLRHKHSNEFENSVILYGSQTDVDKLIAVPGFENSVILYGSQTSVPWNPISCLFENSVILYGSQTTTKAKSLKR